MPIRWRDFIARIAGTVTLFFIFPPSRSVYSGSKRYVVLRAFFRASNLLDELIEVLRGIHEIDFVRVHDQQWRLVVPVKVMRVRLAELLQILWRDRFLVCPPALLDALQQCIKVPLQVNHEVRLRHGLVQQIVQPVVEHQLGVFERQVREDLALRERVVDQDQLREEVALRELLLLVEARQQEEQLGPERRPPPVLVEVVEERVVGVFEDLRPAEPFGEHRDQRRLPDADRPLDRDMTKRKRARHSRGRIAGRDTTPRPMLSLETYELANGLRVVLNEDHSAPLVAVNLWYHVGSKNERPGRTGFAHLFESSEERRV